MFSIFCFSSGLFAVYTNRESIFVFDMLLPLFAFFESNCLKWILLAFCDESWLDFTLCNELN